MQPKLFGLKVLKNENSLDKKKSENNINEYKEEVQSLYIRQLQNENIHFFALADENIKKISKRDINRKMPVNALFRTGCKEKHLIEMATNESYNGRYYNKHISN